MLFLTPEQEKAIVPSKNIWVTASAGSGKTKTLVDRILRLLLQGAQPRRILCLTFTKIAAQEMDHRLQARLRQWAVAPLETLRNDLQRLICKENIDDATLDTARSLFSFFLDEPCFVQTVHGFCQNFLRKFPLEAGLSLIFRVMDAPESQDLWHQCLEDTLRDPSFADPLERLSASFTIHTLQQALRELKEKQALGQKPFYGKAPEYSPAFRQDVPPNFPSKASLLTPDRLAQIFSAPLSPSQDVKRQALHSLPSSETYHDFFITQEGTPRRSLLGTHFPEPMTQWLREEQDRLLKATALDVIQKAIQDTQDLDTLHRGVEKRYAFEKNRRQGLDFDDLIHRTVQMMEAPESMGWILQKLDFQIDHLLVDEAQDNSRAQWRIIQNITESLLTVADHKTAFIVSDPKQLIYEFQGASLEAFQQSQHFLMQCALEMGKPFETSSLSVSFRSTSCVLDVINDIFQGNDCFFYAPHISAHPQKSGGVVFIPAPPASEKTTASSAEYLAKEWSARIQSWLQNPFFLTTQNRSLKAEDILILIPKRGTLFEAFIQALKAADLLKESGKVRNPMVIHDTISLIKWMLNRQDEWALSCVLKGPLFRWTDEEIHHLAYGRGKLSLWQKLQESPKRQDVLETLEKMKGWFYDLSPFQFMQKVVQEDITLKGWPDDWDLTLFDDMMGLVYTMTQTNACHWQPLLKPLEDLQDVVLALPASPECVRLSTVHGAKGSQAPVVIIPDLAHQTRTQDMFFQTRAGLLRLPLKSLPLVASFSDFEIQTPAAHDWKILYVALTRAEERLYLGTSQEVHKHPWCQKIYTGLEKLGKTFPFKSQNTSSWNGTGYFYGQDALIADYSQDF